MKLPFATLCCLMIITPLGCPPTPSAPDSGPPAPEGGVFGDARQSDAQPPPATPCDGAWQRMSALGCAPDSGTWLDACKNAALHSIDMHTACRIKAATCADVQQCEHPAP